MHTFDCHTSIVSAAHERPAFISDPALSLLWSAFKRAVRVQLCAVSAADARCALVARWAIERRCESASAGEQCAEQGDAPVVEHNGAGCCSSLQALCLIHLQQSPSPATPNRCHPPLCAALTVPASSRAAWPLITLGRRRHESRDRSLPSASTRRQRRRCSCLRCIIRSAPPRCSSSLNSGRLHLLAAQILSQRVSGHAQPSRVRDCARWSAGCEHLLVG